MVPVSLTRTVDLHYGGSIAFILKDLFSLPINKRFITEDMHVFQSESALSLL